MMYTAPFYGEAALRRLRPILELLSVAAGASFAASALIHVAIFGLWGVDFSAAASVEDVVLGGFRLLGLWAVTTLIFVGPAVAMLLAPIPAAREGKAHRRETWIPLSMTALALTGYVLAETGLLGPLYTPIAWGVLTAYVAILLWVLWRKANVGVVTIWGYMRPYLVLNAVMAAGLGLALMFMGHRNVDFSMPPELPDDCMRERTILWIGSRSFVLSCAGARHIVYRTEGPIAIYRKR